MRAILPTVGETPRLAPISPRGSTRCVPRMDAVSAGQQLHPRALDGDGDIEGTGLHANVHGVGEASIANQVCEKGNKTKTTCPVALEIQEL